MAAIYRGTPPRSAKRAAIERDLLGATEALLAEGASYSDLNIERIATRAGISRTAFYFYFRDKRELLMRLTEQAAELLYGEADSWWSAEGSAARELEPALNRVIGLYAEHATVLRAVVEAATYDEPVATFWRAIVGRFVQATQARIEAEQAAGRMPPGPAQAIAFALVWASERACYQQFVQGEPLEESELRVGLATIWISTIYGRGAGSESGAG
jgi:TetR/AcrR family transcriptional regulator, ethionamide resistance regulator